MCEEGQLDESTSRVDAGGRTYFFDVKKGHKGDLYLKITESKKTSDSEFERHTIVVWREHIPVFFQGLAKSITAQDNREKLAQIRKEHPRAYEKWSDSEDEDVKKLYSEGKTVSEIAQQLQRQRGAITSRLEKLGLK